jgi:hypothetical protein
MVCLSLKIVPHLKRRPRGDAGRQAGREQEKVFEGAIRGSMRCAIYIYIYIYVVEGEQHALAVHFLYFLKVYR